MLRPSRLRLVSLAAILLIAMASVISAGKMAPSQLDEPRYQALALLGGGPQDVCGHPAGHQAYHCPFCHLLAGPPDPGFCGRMDRLRPDLGPQRLAALVASAQGVPRNVSARGPPRPV